MNANAEAQARYRKKQADEKKRIEDLIERYKSDELDEKRERLGKVKKLMKFVNVDDDGKFRAKDLQGAPNTSILEHIEYLLIMLKKTNEEDNEAHYKKICQAAVDSHNEKMTLIKLLKPNAHSLGVKALLD